MTMTVSGIRCRAYPDVALQAVLPRWIGSQRVIYNAKVDEDRYFLTFARKHPELAELEEPIPIPLDQQYSQFKDRELTPWLFEVPSQVLRNGAYRWMTAKQRQLKGLAKAPRRRKRRDFNSVLLTSELFRFVPWVDKHTGTVRHDIEIGTVKNPVGRMRFADRAPYALPATLVVRRTGSGKWFVSFNFEKPSDVILRSPEELAYELNGLSDEDLSQATIALDRNVKANRLADNHGVFYDFKAVEQKRMARKAVHRKRYQRKLARQVKGSKNRENTKRKIAATYEYGGHVRKNFAHQTSHALVTAPYLLFVFEALQTKNMVRRPKAKQDAKGRWLGNGARAKAGLNAAILGSAWGLTRQFTEYKAAQQNKLVLTVPAAYSSQECCRCGHTHPDNRDAQRFVCQRCGLEMHADTNAAKVQKQRGIQRLREGAALIAKPKKRTAFRRKKEEHHSAGCTPLTAGLDKPAATVCGAHVRPKGPKASRATSVEAEILGRKA